MVRLLRFLKPYRWSVGAALLLVFLQALTELYLPALMADIVDRGIVHQDLPFIWKTGGIMLLVTGVGAIAIVLSSYVSSRVAAGFGRDVRRTIFDRATHFSLGEFEQVGTATMITRTTNDVNQVQQVLVIMMRMMVRAPLMVIGGVIMAVSTDTRLSSIILIVVPIIAGVVILIGVKGLPLFRSIQQKIDRLNLVVREGLTGVRVIRAFHRLRHEERRFSAANHDLMETSIRVNRLMAVMMPSMMLLLNVTTVAIIWFGGLRVDAGDLLVGNLMAFIQYVMQIMFSLLMMTMMFVMLPRAAASAQRIDDVLSIVPGIQDPDQPVSVASGRSVLEFQNVTFRYPGAEQPALSDISFRMEPGEVTAVIGGIGSGKSTLVGLIPRFYDPSEGNILISGTDIRHMRQEDIRQKIGFVSQTASLFSGTIADNIRFGNEDATDEEVERAARIAQAASFIDDMPDGYDSFVAQGGTSLSGGQKQRLTIARAIVRRPEIYIFDDSFSALDLRTEARLRAALKEELHDAAVLIVAQRVSTITEADQIIVLDEGQVAGIGRHDWLVDHCDVYREIVASQMSPEVMA